MMQRGQSWCSVTVKRSGMGKEVEGFKMGGGLMYIWRFMLEYVAETNTICNYPLIKNKNEKEKI